MENDRCPLCGQYLQSEDEDVPYRHASELVYGPRGKRRLSQPVIDAIGFVIAIGYGIIVIACCCSSP